MSSPLAASSPNFYRSPSSVAPGAGDTDGIGAPTLVPSQVLDVEALMKIASERSTQYRAGVPFPHIVLDGLFADSLLDQVIAELPAASERWTTYNTANESKQVCSDA